MTPREEHPCRIATPRKNENRGARVGQTTWERRHPCLHASVSRSLPETTQARMPALPGSLPYPSLRSSACRDATPRNDENRQDLQDLQDEEEENESCKSCKSCLLSEDLECRY